MTARAQRFRRFLYGIGALLVLGTVAGTLEDLSWVLALAVHFRPHLAFAGLCLVLLALAGRRWGLLAIALALVAGNAVPLIPYFRSSDGAVAATGPQVRVIGFNLRNVHTDIEAFRRFIIRTEPDIVLLTELPPDPTGLYEAIADRLPYRVIDRHVSIFDVVLLSRLKPVHWRMDRSVSRFLPVLSADLCDQSRDGAEPRCLRLLGLHAARPFGRGSAWQRAQLEAAAKMASEPSDYPTLLLGDLNLTPWSASFSRLLARTGLRDSAVGHGLQATWPYGLPLIGLPIDHILVSPELSVRDRRLGPRLGSDHLPVIADLALPD
ncbi:MAG: endonuclease/exonuclease/phosphatase family protein [Alphaproteobacteria bacterium]|nr:endonuclease/exonuclease/phosphatase family protein [Alphaproteobacteria bacterium]